MGGLRRSSWLQTVVLLFLCTLPATANAQRFVCSPIAPGDTATGLARRLAGSAAAAYDHAFQIRDPARRMFVPKSHYQRLQPDWQVCVASAPIRNTPVAYAPDVDEAASTVAQDPQAIAPMRVTFASASLTARGERGFLHDPFAATASAAFLAAVLLSAIAGSRALRPIPPPVRRAGERFIAAFAQPLIDESSDVPAIQTRLRFIRRTQQLQIHISPGPGRRYPNLADHQKNVEYDVDRVLQTLGQYALCSPPRVAGRWVVVAITPRTTVARRASKGSGGEAPGIKNEYSPD